MNILVVDDEEDIREALKGILMDEGYRVLLARNGEEALRKVEESPVDLVLLDIWMPGPDGIKVLQEIKKRGPGIRVIMISGHGNIELAVKAVKLGAYDFIEKPFSLDKVLLTIDHALKEKRLEEENKTLLRRLEERYELIGMSKAIRELREQIKVVAPTESWVLITGENGTGKELVARNIHLQSRRRNRPFVEVNCAALPEELIESELFGYEKGAFTGATSRKEGRFDLANGGTIFLDEIGDMSLKTQAKILRVLQEQTFVRVGGTESIKVDVRVIAATNKDLEREIEKGNFRSDLYYRLNVIPFHIPPLRERAEDIPIFVNHFLKAYSIKVGKKPKSVSEEAMDILKAYRWPGNVRELKNLMERLVIMTAGDTIDVEDLPEYIVKGAWKVTPKDATSSFDTASSFKDARNRFEREYILRKLWENKGNISKTAESIGLERSTLYRKMKAYGIEVKEEINGEP